MIATRMIPVLWFRLLVLVVVGIWIANQGTWWVVAFIVAFIALTIWQIIGAYRSRPVTDSSDDSPHPETSL